jgi:hypothetical protein
MARVAVANRGLAVRSFWMRPGLDAGSLAGLPKRVQSAGCGSEVIAEPRFSGVVARGLLQGRREAPPGTSSPKPVPPTSAFGTANVRQVRSSDRTRREYRLRIRLLPRLQRVVSTTP